MKDKTVNSDFLLTMATLGIKGLKIVEYKEKTCKVISQLQRVKMMRIYRIG